MQGIFSPDCADNLYNITYDHISFSKCDCKQLRDASFRFSKYILFVQYLPFFYNRRHVGFSQDSFPFGHLTGFITPVHWYFNRHLIGTGSMIGPFIPWPMKLLV